MTQTDTTFDDFQLAALTPEATGLDPAVIARCEGAPNPHGQRKSLPADAAGITDVVFDFGGVLVNWDPYGPLSARYSDELIHQFRINDVSGFDDANRATDSGHVLASAVEIMSRKGKLWGEMMDYYLERFDESIMGDVAGSRELIRDLHAAGYRCWGLSNWSPENFKDAWNATDIFDLLDGFLVSGFIRDVKPHLSIFRTAEKKFGFAPEHAVFIDDLPNNVKAARNAGWSGIHKKTPQQVRGDLIALGVRIPAIREKA